VYSGIPYFDLARLRGMGVLSGAWSATLVGTRSLPLRMAEYDEKGLLVGRMETIKIDRHPLPPADFAVPAGYTEVRATGNGLPERRDLPR
jgi:hypothetical protein